MRLAEAVVPIVIVVLALGVSGCDERSRPSTGPTVGALPLAVTAIVPKTGLMNSTVRISGTGFSPGAIVTVGGKAANTLVINSTLITATTPANDAGTVDVVVTNPSGQSAQLAGGFTYEVVTLSVSSTVVAPGGQLTVSWVAPGGRSAVDWLGFFKLGDPSTNYESGWWDYTNGATSGTFVLTAPTQAGQYEFRYLLDDGYVDVARSTPITVQ